MTSTVWLCLFPHFHLFSFFHIHVANHIARSRTVLHSDILPYNIKLIFQYPEILISNFRYTEYFEDEGSNSYLHTWSLYVRTSTSKANLFDGRAREYFWKCWVLLYEALTMWLSGHIVNNFIYRFLPNLHFIQLLKEILIERWSTLYNYTFIPATLHLRLIPKIVKMVEHGR